MNGVIFMRLLLIEDDIDLCEAVSLQLKKEGYEVDICNNGEDADYYISSNSHDAIILDRMLPGVDGLTILQRLRNRMISTPVIMVTAMNGINDRVDGLDSGADDYIVKPYAVAELMARIRAVLRRPQKIEDKDVLHYSDLEFNINTLITACGNVTVSLTKREGALLEYFLINREQVLTREQILSRVWGIDSFVEEGNIDNYIFFLRRRLRGMNTKVYIKTIHGVGYRLESMQDV